MHKLTKSRDIPLSEYYTILQLEYMGYYLRKKIYKRQCDIKKFGDICQQKKEKIESISLKNCLPSIFNNQERKTKYFTKFFNEFGMPNFYYRDEYQKDVKGMWDVIYYFDKGCSVKVNINGLTEVGEVSRVNVSDNISVVLIDGKEFVLEIDKIGRIFPDNFFEDFNTI